jgi:phage shock protein PspC (stress-responsive transcriptional regulator)
MTGTQALRRSRRYRILGGVCGGIAEWLGWKPTMVRVLYVLLSILSAGFPGLVVYIILWLVMPEAEEATA